MLRVHPTTAVILAAALLGALILLHRKVTRGLCRVYVRDGRVHRVVGRLPHGVLGDLLDALSGSGARGTIRLMDGGRDTGTVELEGDFDPLVAQRVRNVLGNVKLARLRG